MHAALPFIECKCSSPYADKTMAVRDVAFLAEKLEEIHVPLLHSLASGTPMQWELQCFFQGKLGYSSFHVLSTDELVSPLLSANQPLFPPVTLVQNNWQRMT